MRGPAHRRRARPRLSATGRAHFALDESDRSGVTDLLQTVQSATLNGTVVTGTLDVAQLKSESGPLRYLRSQLSGPSAFTAQLDPQGRLTKLAVDLPAPGHVDLGHHRVRRRHPAREAADVRRRAGQCLPGARNDCGASHEP